MPQYEVEVSRIGTATRKIHVEAGTEEQAMTLAINDAGNYIFSEQTVEYEIEYVKKREETEDHKR